MFRTFVFIAFLLGQFAFCQSTGSIYGKITDGNALGEPLLFANISLTNAGIVEQTNFHGNFEVTDLKPGSYVLQINYLGYEPKEISIKVKSGEVVIVEESLHMLSLDTESILISEASTIETKEADNSLKN